MATTAAFKNGLCIYHQGELYTIVSFQHVKPGKGGAFVRTKLKSLETSKVVAHTFNAGVRIDTARIERRLHQFTYQDEAGYHFMDSKTYEEVVLAKEQVPEADFLKEGQEQIEILFHAEKGTVLSCVLPPIVTLCISYTEPGLKGDTATNTLKSATLETGATLQVPLFSEEGMQIKVDVREGKYAGKVT